MKDASPEWVDWHCHLDLYPNHAELIRSCDSARIATLAVTTTPKAWSKNQEMASTSEYVSVGLGLHPQLVGERADELQLLMRYLPHTKFVGEIGLDASPKHYKSLPDQEKVFSTVLQACAEQGGKILSIHSVRSVNKVLGHIERYLKESARPCIPVLHWFTGTPSEARRAVQLGCYFSINATMLDVPKTQSLVAALPADRMLTETDGPFTEMNGAPSKPSDVAIAVQKLSSIWGESVDDAKNQIVTNLVTMLHEAEATASVGRAHRIRAYSQSTQ